MVRTSAGLVASMAAAHGVQFDSAKHYMDSSASLTSSTLCSYTFRKAHVGYRQYTQSDLYSSWAVLAAMECVGAMLSSHHDTCETSC